MRSLRDKLLKFVQRVPVFMYLTDFREQALVDVIESLDTQLFERVTGLTLEDFHNSHEVGVFQPAHMNEAIWQFRLFERASLDYLGTVPETDDVSSVGLWDRTIDEQSLDSGHTPTDERLTAMVREGLLNVGDVLVAANGESHVAVVTSGPRLEVDGRTFATPEPRLGRSRQAEYTVAGRTGRRRGSGPSRNCCNSLRRPPSLESGPPADPAGSAAKTCLRAVRIRGGG